MDPGSIERLPIAARDRLARFARAFERIDASQYALFAARPLDSAAHERARESAEFLIAGGSRRDAIRAVVDEFREWVVGAFGRFELQAITGIGPRFGTPRDIQDGLAALESAVIALILWDQLEPSDRDE